MFFQIIDKMTYFKQNLFENVIIISKSKYFWTPELCKMDIIKYEDDIDHTSGV